MRPNNIGRVDLLTSIVDKFVWSMQSVTSHLSDIFYFLMENHVPFCEYCGKERQLKVSNKRKTIGKHYYACRGCGRDSFVKIDCLSKAHRSDDASASSASATIISNLVSRCQALEQEVASVSADRDSFKKKSDILDKIMGKLKLDDN